MIELRMGDINQAIERKHLFLLLLNEVGGDRRLPLMLEEQDAKNIELCLKGLNPFQIPVVALFCKSAETFGFRLNYVNIDRIERGVLIAKLCCSDPNAVSRVVEVRCEDAVMLAAVFRCRIYTTDQLLNQQYSQDDGNGHMNLPINSINIELLKEALECAIHDERYELAAILRDEIKRRLHK